VLPSYTAQISDNFFIRVFSCGSRLKNTGIPQSLKAVWYYMKSEKDFSKKPFLSLLFYAAKTQSFTKI